MKRIIFISLLVLIVISIVFITAVFEKSKKVQFVRMKFSIPDKAIGKNKDGSMTGFIKVNFKEGSKFYIFPEVEGEKGILLNLRGKRDSGTGNVITTNIVRKGNIVFSRSEKFTKRGFNYLLSESFNFSKNDKLEISISGSGTAFIRDPLFYSIVDPEKRKYVFVIALDNLRYDRIGRKVNGVDLTPNLNDFKKDSVSFKNGFSQSSWTLPAFTSFFTGLNEFNHGITRGSALAEAIPMLTDRLSKKFVTISINGGVWLGPGVTGRRGFDLFKIGSKLKNVDAAEHFFEKSIRFLEKHELPELFLFMHTYAIHAPYHPPERFLYEIVKNPKHKSLSAFTRSKQFKKGISEEDRIAREILYDADVKAFDHYFGKFVEYLKREKIYDKSLMVFTSDHGEEFYEHGGWFHGHSLYNELIRIPIIIKLPDNRFAGKVLEHNIGIIDILPTIADINDIEMPSGIDGISLLPIIKGKKISDRSYFSSSAICLINNRIPGIVAIINKNFKYIYNILGTREKSLWRVFHERGAEELYDLNKDPRETTNVIKDYPVIAKQMKRELIKVLKKVKLNSSKSKFKKNKISEKDKKSLKTLGYL